MSVFGPVFCKINVNQNLYMIFFFFFIMLVFICFNLYSQAIYNPKNEETHSDLKYQGPIDCINGLLSFSHCWGGFLGGSEEETSNPTKKKKRNLIKEQEKVDLRSASKVFGDKWIHVVLLFCFLCQSGTSGGLLCGSLCVCLHFQV